MTIPLLKTKLYIPRAWPELVPRPRLIERLDVGLHRKLTLISAPAGFGKTTLLSEWVASCKRIEHQAGGQDKWPLCIVYIITKNGGAIPRRGSDTTTATATRS